MRTGIVAFFAVLMIVGNAYAQCVDQLEVECAEQAIYPGDVCVTLRLTTCSAPFRAFGVEILFPDDCLSFQGLLSDGTLTSGWVQVDATVLPGTPARLRVGGYDAEGFGIQIRSGLLKICFDLTADVPSGSEISVDESTMVDDLDGAIGIGCRMPSLTPVEDSTWGRIKSLFN